MNLKGNLINKILLAILASFGIANITHADGDKLGDPKTRLVLDYEVSGRCAKYFSGSKQDKRIVKPFNCRIDIQYGELIAADYGEKIAVEAPPLNQPSSTNNPLADQKLEIKVFSGSKNELFLKKVKRTDLYGFATANFKLAPNTKRKSFYRIEVNTLPATEHTPPFEETCGAYGLTSDSSVCAMQTHGLIATFESTCDAIKHQANVLYDGACRYSEGFCTREYLPVCGTSLDGKRRTYGNLCGAEAQEAVNITLGAC